MQYNRNDVDFSRGNFRVRGDTIEIIPVYEEYAIRIELFGDEIEALYMLHPLTGDVVQKLDSVPIFPASHYVAGTDTCSVRSARSRPSSRCGSRSSRVQSKLLEAQRLRMRTSFDLEMMQQLGFCSGIENYSRHLDGRAPGEAPHCLLDFFPDDFLVVIDESHATVPQIGAMYEGDASRKRTLVEHGFRLPSAMDNRPLRWDEFKNRVGQTVYLSATPGRYEMGIADGVVEQIIRPTGLVDPRSWSSRRRVRSTTCSKRSASRARERNERVLVTTLTKKMAEELTDFLGEHGVRVRYLHSDVDTLRRVELLTELRAGVYDVLVGINLLREGLDLPEVSLVSILDADKEGFLRSGTSLIQTIGRAARNVSGEVHMYADTITDSMKAAIEETDRRRDKQIAYNLENGIDPTPLRKRIADITEVLAREGADTAAMLSKRTSRSSSPARASRRRRGCGATGIAAEGAEQLEATIADLSRSDARRRRRSSSSSSPPGCATRCRT